MSANCNGTSTENTPLFPSIWATMPEMHTARGLEIATSIVRINPAGIPAGNGRIIMANFGMSNQKQQFAALMEAYRLKYGRGRPMTTVNLGTGNWDLSMMVEQEEEYEQLLLNTLIKKKATAKQIQIAIFKNSIRFQEQDYPADVNQYIAYMEKYRQFLIRVFPNLKLWFVLFPVYSGYASGSAPRHEPYVFREGLAVNEFVRRHYGETAPWIGFGPYYWANGLVPRGDGLIWKCNHFIGRDGVHPSALGLGQTTEMLMRFFENSPVTKKLFTGIE